MGIGQVIITLMPPEGNNVQFQSEGNEYGPPPQQAEGFDLTGKLVQWGLVSSRQEAQYVLIGVAVLALLIAAYFLLHSTGSSLPPPPPIS